MVRTFSNETVHKCYYKLSTCRDDTYFTVPETSESCCCCCCAAGAHVCKMCTPWLDSLVCFFGLSIKAVSKTNIQQNTFTTYFGTFITGTIAPPCIALRCSICQCHYDFSPKRISSSALQALKNCRHLCSVSTTTGKKAARESSITCTRGASYAARHALHTTRAATTCCMCSTASSSDKLSWNLSRSRGAALRVPVESNRSWLTRSNILTTMAARCRRMRKARHASRWNLM